VSRAALAAVAVATLFALGGCGAEDGGSSSGSDAFEEVSRQPSLTRTARRAGPRWERVARLTGDVTATHPISIAPGAIQARARWRCTGEEIALALTPAPRTPPDKPGGSCPGRGEMSWVGSGDQRLKVTATGSWSVVIEQQVDTPIKEPMLAAMRASGARLLKSGSFFDVERQGSGRARLYRLADGRGALRLDPFRTSANTDLVVWFSTAARPRTTKAAVKAKRLAEIPLKATIGSQNYLLPKGVDPRRIKSIAIWCIPIQIIYTAAPLRG